jgi:GNAT superfamily N-acetyltransferase
VSEGEVALDALLAGAGYAIADPTLIYAAPLAALAWPGAAEAHWPWPDEAAAIWDEGGIGPARRAVMTRAEGPKTALLARLEGAPAATAFLALHEGVAMIHALETRPAFRRRGAARAILGAARAWAGARGARTFALAVTERNKAARALYISLGLAVAGSYHYRMKPVLP